MPPPTINTLVLGVLIIVATLSTPGKRFFRAEWDGDAGCLVEEDEDLPKWRLALFGRGLGASAGHGLFLRQQGSVVLGLFSREEGGGVRGSELEPPGMTGSAPLGHLLPLSLVAAGDEFGWAQCMSQALLMALALFAFAVAAGCMRPF
eukprot:gene10665-9056_t